MPICDYSERLDWLRGNIQESEEIAKTDKGLLLDYSRDLRLNGHSDARNYKLVIHMKKVAENSDVSLKKAGKEDVKDMVAWVLDRDLSSETVRDYKIAIRVFYKWLSNGEFNSGSCPKEVRWISTTRKKKNRKLPEDVLLERDVTKMIESATNERTEALIALLWETGARIGEIIDLKPDDFRDYKHGFQVVIGNRDEEGKTGPRRLPLIISPPYVKGWFEEHPLRDSDRWPDVPLWSELQVQEHGDQKKEAGQKASYDALKRDIERTAERAGISKPVNPHHFRHSRATYMASRFTEAQMCEWFGWVQGSKQPAKYVHMAGRDIDGAYESLHGIEEKEEKEPEMVPQECPRCGLEGIEATGKFCPRCGQALTREAFQEVEEKRKATDSVLEDLLSDPDFKKLISKKVDDSVAERFDES